MQIAHLGHRLVDEQRLPSVFYLWDGTLEVERFRQHDLEDLDELSMLMSRKGKRRAYLLDVDAVAGAAKDETGTHGLGESSCLATSVNSLLLDWTSHT